MISQIIDSKQEKLLCFEALSEKITLAWIFSTIRDQELSDLMVTGKMEKIYAQWEILKADITASLSF